MHPEDGRVVSTFVCQALRGEPLTIYGDGEQTRSFCYVADMVAAGWSPSVRLFEAGACGAAIISDSWEGLESILRPPDEIVLADRTEDVLAAFARNAEAIGAAGRRRITAQHSADRRAAQFEEDLALARLTPRAHFQERLDYATP
jgi:spore maturation protein CgeB